MAFFSWHPKQLCRPSICGNDRSIMQADEKLILVGHSFGAALCLKAANQQQDLVLGLVLIGPYVPRTAAPGFFTLAAWLFYLPEWVKPGPYVSLKTALCHVPRRKFCLAFYTPNAKKYIPM